jgi:hypothetical protein
MWLGATETAFGALIAIVLERLFGVQPTAVSAPPATPPHVQLTTISARPTSQDMQPTPDTAKEELKKGSGRSFAAKIFLTYASEDKTTAESIAFSLRQRHHVAFLDRDDLPPGRKL